MSEQIADPVGRWKAFRRSLRPLRVIAERDPEGPLHRDALVSTVVEICARAAASDQLGERSVGLWRLEKLGFCTCRHGRGTLDEAAIPESAQPILHVGMGIAATETAGFEVVRVGEVIEAQAHPDYRLFSFESVGCIWAVYASPIYRTFFRWVSGAGIPVTKLPAWSSLIHTVPVEIERVMSHGYGRTLYFKHLSLRRAIRAARRIPSLDIAAAAQGIAFACAMLNHDDLDSLLTGVPTSDDSEVATGLRRGFVYALAFWQWTFGDVLDRVESRTLQRTGLVREARDLIRESRSRGMLATFL
ncbi:MAG: hypothetical protein MPN21_15685 [Thermoanaerobaculia bacterium]|nr:hypothetical protein [Thermoanaerobaculia bacterium]